MMTDAAVSDIAHTIQLAVAPVFLLAGIAGLLNLMASRLQRVVDRSRHLATLHAESTGEAHKRHVWELRLMDRRITMISLAIAMGVGSAIAICIVVALLFIATMVKLDAAAAVAVIFVLAMILLTAALSLFLIEVRIAIHGIRVPAALLEKEAAEEAAKLKRRTRTRA